MAALEAGALELVSAPLARAVGFGQCTGAIRRAAGDLLHVVQAREGVGQTDDDHALKQQRRMERSDRHLLAAMLGRGGAKYAADLADQRTLHPVAAGLVEEVAHLRAHIAEARGCAEYYGVVIRELVYGRDWRSLVQLHVGFPSDVH